MLSLFMQGTNPDGRKAQALIVPSNMGEARVFWRVVTPGARGQAGAWSESTDKGEHALPPMWLNMPLDAEPVAVAVSASDLQQIIERGAPTMLGTKSQSALANSPASDKTMGDYWPSGYSLVAGRDPFLNVYYRDGRRGLNASATPVVTPASVTPTVAPATVAVDETQPATSPEEPALAMCMATVPDSALAKRYVHRTVYGADDFAIYDHARAVGENVLIKGPTGAAKTMSAMAYAAARGLRCFLISGSLNFEVSQALGKVVLRDGVTRWQDGGLTQCVREGDAVVILDEINIFPGKMLTPLYPLLADTRQITLLDNKGETIQAAPGLLIVGTYNPGYIGTQAMSFALENRFAIHLDWGYDEAVEKKLVTSKSVRALGAQLRAAEAKSALNTPTPTNALMDIETMTKSLGIEFAIGNFLARYDESERASVKLALDTHRLNIEQDLGLVAEVTVEQDEVFSATPPWLIEQRFDAMSQPVTQSI